MTVGCRLALASAEEIIRQEEQSGQAGSCFASSSLKLMNVLLIHMEEDFPAYSNLALGQDFSVKLGLAGMPPMEPPLLRLRWRDAAYAWSSSQQHAYYE